MTLNGVRKKKNHDLKLKQNVESNLTYQPGEPGLSPVGEIFSDKNKYIEKKL